MVHISTAFWYIFGLRLTYSNILEVGYQKKWNAHKIARCLKKANHKRAELLPLTFINLASDDSECLNDVEASFLKEYRYQIHDGSQFNISKEKDVKKILAYVNKLFQGIEEIN